MSCCHKLHFVVILATALFYYQEDAFIEYLALKKIPAKEKQLALPSASESAALFSKIKALATRDRDVMEKARH